MPAQLSSKELEHGLQEILDSLRHTQQTLPPQVVFLHDYALYRFLCTRPCDGRTIGEVLTDIEHCIPMSVSGRNLPLFLSLLEEGEDSTEHLSFLESSKTEFLLMLYRALSDETRLRSICKLCEQLRRGAHFL